MAYSPVVNVQITINAVNLTQAGFGTPIFICAHQQTDARVIDITSPADLTTPVSEGGYGFATNSSAYIAASRFFENSPTPTIVKIGRRGGKSVSTMTLLDGVVSETYNVSVTHLKSGSVYTASHAHTAGTDTAESVCDELITQLKASGAADFETVMSIVNTGTGAGGNITIASLDDDYTFQVETSTSQNTSDVFGTSFEGTELAASTVDALTEYDSDFYFITSEVRPTGTGRAFCQDLSTKTQELDKQYFVSSGDQADIDLVDADSSFFKYTFENSRTQTVTLMHHYGASTTVYGESFPECYYVGYNAPYSAGAVTWCNLKVSLPASGQPTNTVKPLTPTQLGKLLDNNVNFVQKDAGINVLRTGITSGGEWIDVVRGVHWLKEDMTVSLKGLLYNQKGGKVPFTDSGIARIREVMQSSLQRAVNRGFLVSYTLEIPLVRDVPNNEWVKRVLNNARFTGILAGAIHQVNVAGEVTTPSAK